MTPSINASSPTPPAGSSQSTPAAPAKAVDKNMFLQLLVAQLKHQDPLNPSDSTQFVTQLAQFQQMEQATNTGSDITAIRQDMDKLVTNSSTTAQKS
jgi:flagellar basal-body rod modification protein FlgD